MGRRRNKGNQALPKGVYRNKSGYIYREYKGRVDGKTIPVKDVFLAPLDAPLSYVLAAYEKIDATGRGTISWLLREYHQSPAYKKIASKGEYERYLNTLTGYPTKTGKLGDASLEQITKRTIRSFLDKYKDGGAPVAANRHIQYLKAAWNWAEERYAIPQNPCTGVKLNEERPRERYVSSEEFEAVKAMAKGYVPIVMELAYLCRARRSEVCALKVSDCLPGGLRLQRSKGSQGEITEWTPRLRAAVESAKAFCPGAPSPVTGTLLIHDKHGQPIKKNAWDSAWQRLMKKWVDAGGERFTVHDLKAAGYSDQEEQYAGHKSEKMHKTYNRKLRVVKPPQ